jgi:hypothetical protein
MQDPEELFDFESTEGDMHIWSNRWDFSGYELVCRSCGARQCPGSPRRPFRHRPGCEHAAGPVDLPWRDLTAIFRKACRRSSA